MNTPIYDFIEQYVRSRSSRFHMPGHKGHVFLGCEPWDITEIAGADVLHQATGIIAESQRNAAQLFQSGRTFYSTEGSSLCIKAMLASLVQGCSNLQGEKRTRILAMRNVHRAMVDACALLDLDLEFVTGERQEHICTGVVSPKQLREFLQEDCRRRKDKPCGIYVTSPDYLGNLADIAGLAEVCEEYGIPLVVDNAHGAYLGFLEPSAHPIALGAAMCCDSAHKTLPVLTGGAYLHLAEKYQSRYAPFAEKAMAVFGSTSPSYLILESLDLCNRYLAEGYRDRLAQTVRRLEQMRSAFRAYGIPLTASEPLKMVIRCSDCGYTGVEIAQEMRQGEIECEYADDSYLVLMATPENAEDDYKRLCQWASSTILRREPGKPLENAARSPRGGERACSVREAVFGKSETIPVEQSLGRICAAECVACPPAVPIAVSGERITEEMVSLFQKHEICDVVVLVNEP